MAAWFVHKMRLAGAIATIALYAFCATQTPATVMKVPIGGGNPATLAFIHPEPGGLRVAVWSVGGAK